MNEQEPKKQTEWANPSRVVLIVDLIGTMLLAVMTLRTAPKFKAIFTDLFGTAPLPRITEFFVSIPFTGYLILFSGVMIALVLKEIAIRNKVWAFTINMALLLAGILYFVFYVAAMFLPLLVTIGALAEKP
jgi:hypothetical protein